MIFFKFQITDASSQVLKGKPICYSSPTNFERNNAKDYVTTETVAQHRPARIS